MRVAVIGAGASGIAAAIALARRGIDYVVFEKANDVGGTWRDNVYPGLACDIPSHLYRYSFEPNAEWEWEYAPGSDIHKYLSDVAEKHAVRQHTRFGKEIITATFDDSGWHIESQQGNEGFFDAVIAATGILHQPIVPEIPGAASFAGTSFHSSRWDPTFNVDGRNVGIIGTGSTAVQILPAIIDKVESCALFQRTPQWILPVANNRISEERRCEMRQKPEKMQSLYDLLSDRFNNIFAAAVVGENPSALAETAAACRANLDENVHDVALRRRLTPDYDVGCKRLVVSDKFYPALQKPNATLVDTPIECIEPAGVRTHDGILHKLDTLVYATGFNPFYYVRPMKVRGRNGVALDDVWVEGTTAYRSIGIPGFPNFFLVGGPNSPIGNFSFIMTAEVQISYIMQLVDLLATHKAREVAPTEAATQRFNNDVRAAMPSTVWVTGGCRSWYMDKSGNIGSWPWTFGRFMGEMAEPQLADFELR